MNNEIREVIMEYLRRTAEVAGFAEPQDLADIIGNLIRVALSFLGIIFIILILYGGFTLMTSAGNDMKVHKAKKIIEQAIIGTVIVLSSYAITAFIFSMISSSLE